MTGPKQPCAYCGGSGETSDVDNFLLSRMRAGLAHDWRWIGISSDAMVLAAATDTAPRHAPHDGWDLGRCLLTYEVAPGSLKPAMKLIVDRWTKEMREREKDQPKHGYGVKEAEAMCAEHLDAVRELQS